MKFLWVEWLRQVANRTGFERTFTRGLVREGGDKDDWDALIGRRELAMQLQATHTRHLHIDDETRCLTNAVRIQKSLARIESARGQAERLYEFFCCLADHLIVIDNGNQRLSLRSSFHQ